MRHIQSAQKLAKIMGYQVGYLNMLIYLQMSVALERVSEQAAFMFFVVADLRQGERKSCFCVGICVPAEFNMLSSKEDPEVYIARLTKQMQGFNPMTKRDHEKLQKIKY